MWHNIRTCIRRGLQTWGIELEVKKGKHRGMENGGVGGKGRGLDDEVQRQGAVGSGVVGSRAAAIEGRGRFVTHALSSKLQVLPAAEVPQGWLVPHSGP